MRQLPWKIRLGVAVIALIGPCSIAVAAATDEVVVRRTARIVAPPVLAIDIDPVPGFTKKTRGDRLVFCRTEQKIGTRFKTETCIDHVHMPAYLAALEENRQQVRRIRYGDNRIN